MPRTRTPRRRLVSAFYIGAPLLALACASAWTFAGAQQPEKPAKVKEGKSRGYSFTTNQKYSYILFRGEGSTFVGGSWNEAKARLLKNREKDKQERLIVFRDGKEYLITDKETLEGVAKALAPVEKLGKQMGELGRQQGELGRRQGELGRLQGELGRQMGELAHKQVELSLRESPTEGGRERRERLRKEFEQSQAEIGRKMEELGRQQAAFGKRQEPLGKQQQQLGKQMETASKQADKDVTERIDRAFEKGLAQPAPAAER